MIHAWRIIKRKHAARAFTGEGAKLFGGRWNQKGVAVVYAADSLALAVLEQFIHLGREGLHLSFAYFRISIPDNIAVTHLNRKNLPKNWRDQPPPASTRQIGSKWARSEKSAVMRAPSAVTPHSYIFLINPLHADFAKLKISAPAPFSFDSRMWK